MKNTRRLLDGEVAIVTGGSEGVGKAVARALASEGALVAVCSRSAKNGILRYSDFFDSKTPARLWRSSNRTIASFRVDVTRWLDVKRMVQAVIRKFGRVDILVNNAGGIVIKPFLEQREDDWDKVMDVNAKGTFHCCKAVVPFMKRQGQGRIINISSEAGKKGIPYMIPYSSAKHAVIGLSKSLAIELAPYGIMVNAICPGLILDTNMRTAVDDKFRKLGRTDLLPHPPLSRYLKPEDIARTVVRLCSSDHKAAGKVVLDLKSPK